MQNASDLGVFYQCEKKAANFTLRKFYTVKNWYQFLIARENLVPIHQICRSNISHFVKNTYEVKFTTSGSILREYLMLRFVLYEKANLITCYWES